MHCTDRCEGQATVHFSFAQDAPAHSIHGQIRGPFCEHSRTLPANSAIRQGKAVLVDPCFWTPKLPFLYELRLTYETEAGPREEEVLFGLRWCIADGANLRLDGKGYVVRAVAAGAEPDLDALREVSAGLVMSEFSEATCIAASKLGVLIVCTQPLTPELALATQRFPAVHFARGVAGLSDVIPLVSDTPLKRSVCLTDESDLVHNVDYSREPPRFVVRQNNGDTLSELRKECDRLQRDAASFGQFAGYLIDSPS